MTESTWPVVMYEPHPWQTSLDRREVSSRQWLEMRRPYEAAVTAPIAGSEVRLPSVLAADVDEAAVLLARFDAQAGEAVLPFSSILLRSESASSSQIENLSSSARAVAESELGERIDGNAALIVRNVRAMRAALDLADDLTHESVVEMQRVMLGDSAPDLTGRYRTQQVWIGGSSVSPHRAEYVAPAAARVADAMADLLEFAARTDVPVIAHAAIAHAQFETIHPFLDGNGRTGRALVQAMLRRRGTTASVTVPVSAGLLHDLDRYFGALTAYRQGDVEPIVRVFADAAGTAVRNGNELVSDIRDVRGRYDDLLSDLRTHAAARDVVDLLFEHPVVNAAIVQERLGVSDQAAYRAFDALVERGIVASARARRRNRMWAALDITDALDRFADRAGRRARP